MSEPESPQKHRLWLLEQIGKASDEISRIDSILRCLLEGGKGQGGAGAA
jgi:hypothetical protein